MTAEFDEEAQEREQFAREQAFAIRLRAWADTFPSHKACAAKARIRQNKLSAWMAIGTDEDIGTLPSFRNLMMLALAGFNVQGALLNEGPISYSPDDMAALQELAAARAVHAELVSIVAESQSVTDRLATLAAKTALSAPNPIVPAPSPDTPSHE